MVPKLESWVDKALVGKGLALGCNEFQSPFSLATWAERCKWPCIFSLGCLQEYKPNYEMALEHKNMR